MFEVLSLVTHVTAKPCLRQAGAESVAHGGGYLWSLIYVRCCFGNIYRVVTIQENSPFE